VRVIVSAAADNDLMLIFSYLHQQSPQAAEAIASEIDRCFQNMSSFPFSGFARSELGQDVRSVLVLPYVIFYAARSDHITVLRVLHGSRNIEAEFRR
jgi:toxin ParE1/3/4